MFGAGASNVIAPVQSAADTAAVSKLTNAAAENANSPEAEQRQVRALRALKAHGLWNNSTRDPGEVPPTQPRIGLPRAVIGSDVDPSTPVIPGRIPLPEVGAPLPAIEPKLLERNAGAQLKAANQNALVQQPPAAAPAREPELSMPPEAASFESSAPASVPVSEPVLAEEETPSLPVAVSEPAVELPRAAAPAPAEAPAPAQKVASVAPPPQHHVAPRVERQPRRDMRWLVALLALGLVLSVLLGGAVMGWWRLPFIPSRAKLTAPAAETHGAVETHRAPSRQAPTDTAAAIVANAPQPAAAAAQPAAAEPAAEAQPQQAEAPPAEAEAVEPETDGKLAASPSDSVADQLREARKLLKAKHPESAEALLRQMLDRTPEDQQIATLLTQSLIAQRNGREALSYAQQLVRRRPKRSVSHVLLGDALQLTGNKTGAVSEWREALQLDTSSREARRRLLAAGETLVASPAPQAAAAEAPAAAGE